MKRFLLLVSVLFCQFRFAQSSQAANADSVINSIQMVCVDGGGFYMGSSLDPPSHRVVLSSFYIGKYELTFEQWAAIMGTHTDQYSGCEKCPVSHISWNEVQAFIAKLNNKTGKHYRLPTEAEWEYAAIGGRKSKSYSFSGSNIPNEVSWNYDNSGRKAHEVGQKMPNELGIYDMTGNVMEMCSDWFGNYDPSDKFDPKGPSKGEVKVARGGSYDFIGSVCLVRVRKGWLGTNDKDMICGFRLAMEP